DPRGRTALKRFQTLEEPRGHWRQVLKLTRRFASAARPPNAVAALPADVYAPRKLTCRATTLLSGRIFEEQVKAAARRAVDASSLQVLHVRSIPIDAFRVDIDDEQPRRLARGHTDQ